eukprot:TRINITY_DN7699_c0_g1_i1.p1 TRINITY_DN7699_c0_g1~~TRINITY_DN7699_c0_g1_i1.p1  ORF type:complete len:145 (+),score=24.89 TRINITY_DN7699_c0_g1_i1:281-715(+)
MREMLKEMREFELDNWITIRSPILNLTMSVMGDKRKELRAKPKPACKICLKDFNYKVKLECGHEMCKYCAVKSILEANPNGSNHYYRCFCPPCSDKKSMRHIELDCGCSVLKNDRDYLFLDLSLIHICRCRRYAVCRSRWSPYH